MKNNMLRVIYVDDTIFTGPIQQAIEKEIGLLGIKQPHEESNFEFCDEGDVSTFLEIKIGKKSRTKFYLSQPVLINKVIKAAGMSECNPNTTPSTMENLGPDLNGPVMEENWEYGSTIKMLMYLVNNTRPDIAHAVHTCARFTHNPKKSHAPAVKQILRYLQGIRDKEMNICPNNLEELNSYVESDVADNYRTYPDQDPSSVKSHTEYVILYQDCP